MLFTWRKNQQDVQRVLLRLANQNCGGTLHEGPRAEQRVCLATVVLIVPCEGRQPRLEEAFTATTKDLSSEGISLLTQRDYRGDQVLVGLKLDGEMQFLRGEVRHWEPFLGDYQHVGIRLAGVVPPGDYPGLETLHL